MDLHRPAAIAVGRDDHVTADDWAILTTAHPAVLLIGPDAATQTLLSELWSCLRPPASWWAHEAAPGPLPTAGALIIYDIGALDLDQQQRLLDWIEGQGRDVQVVSVSARPVFPLVETGAFLGDLYYRLNIVFLHLAASSAEDIAHRAYELYEQRGGEHGHDWHDWFQAERELHPCQDTQDAVLKMEVATHAVRARRQTPSEPAAGDSRYLEH